MAFRLINLKDTSQKYLENGIFVRLDNKYQCMGVQLFPALEGYDQYHFWDRSRSAVDWKSIPHKLTELDEISEQLGIAPISSFVNSTRDDSPFDDETMDEFEQEGELIDGVWYYQGAVLWSVEPQWFVPEQGLVTVRTLLNHLRSLQGEEILISEALANNDQDWDGDSENDYRGVINELETIETILSRAVQEKKLFQICILD